MSASTPNCPFLDVPKEIRLMIFRLLLLPQTLLSMTPADSEIDDWSDVESDEEDDEEEGAIVSIDFSDDSDHNEHDRPDSDSDESDLHEDAHQYITKEEANQFSKEDYAMFRRYPAILRTNRQIYNEASSLLYTEGILVIEPADLFALAKKPHSLEFGVPAQDVWKHHPLQDPGQALVNGMVNYTTAEMGGRMYPHIFARFQKIHFDAAFDFEHTQNVELWIDDNTHIVRKEDADVYKQTLRKSSVMKDFVGLLSQSPLITKLQISLEVEVMANSNLMMEEVDEDDDLFDEKEDKIDRLMDVSNERATELFLDSGICEPLLKLTNVKSFDFTVGFMDRDEDANYEPLPQHAKMLEGMKKTIEANFNVKLA